MASGSTVVVGAGPPGLAAAAMLGRHGVEATVLERGDGPATSWRGHYDSLCLHTVRSLSSLPGTPLPPTLGRWVARDGFVAYLEEYAASHRLAIRTGVTVRRIDRAPGGYTIDTTQGPVEARSVVVATGYTRVPVIPDWPGRERFEGRLLHSSEYRNASSFRGLRVLVVGAGNSGSDIAVDLAAGGAETVWLSVRRPPCVVPRQALGVPAQVAAIGLHRLPTPVADALAALERRAFIGRLDDQGLPGYRNPVFSRRRREGVLPILDFGFVARLREWAFRVVPGVEGFAEGRVVLDGDRSVSPDAVIAATGYRPGLEPLVGHLGLLGARGDPRVHGASADPAAPALHFTGFRNPITGALRELRSEAAGIAGRRGVSHLESR
jgi:putative flavoprotein involved in K+ transport